MKGSNKRRTGRRIPHRGFLQLRIHLFLLFVFGGVYALLAQENNKSLVVVVEEAAPLFQHTDGAPPKGILVDFWRLWSKRSGIPISFVGVRAGEAVKTLKQGGADIALGIPFDETLSTQLLYSRPFFNVPLSLYYRAALLKPPSTLNDLADLRVGVLKGGGVQNMIATVQPSAELEHYLGPEEYANTVLLIEAAIKGDIDAFVVETPLASVHLTRLDAFKAIRKAPAPLVIRHLHAVVTTDRRRLFSQLNRGIVMITTDEVAAIVKKYKGDIWAAGGTLAPEKVIIASSSGSAPFHFANEKGEPAGMIIDLWRLWSERVGIPVEFRTVAWGETLKLVRDGHADIHAGLFYSEERGVYMDYASALFKSETHFFHHKRLPKLALMSDLLPYRVGMIKGDFAVGHFKKKAPLVSLGLYESNDALFNSVEDGESLVFVKDTPIAIYHLAKRGILDQYSYPVQHPLYSNIFYAGVREGDRNLLTIVAQGMQAITPEERAGIARKWLGASETKVGDVLTIAIPRDYAPFASLNLSGEPVGLVIDLWRLWAQKTNQRIEFRAFDWVESLRAVKNGDADFHCGLFRTEDRKEWAVFSQPFYKVASGFFYPVTSEDIRGPQDLVGKAVGVVRGTFQEEYLAKEHSTLQVVLYRSSGAMVEGVRRGEIQAFLDEVPVGNATLTRLGQAGNFKSSSEALFLQNLHSAVWKGNPALLKLLDEGLEAITPKELADIEERWIRNRSDRLSMEIFSTIRLTAAEEEWLKRHSRVTLGVHSARSPFEWIDEKGGYQGMVSDYVRLLEERLGIGMEVISGPDRGVIIDKARTRQVDLLPCVTPTAGRRSYLTFSAPYLSFPEVIITRNDTRFVGGIGDLSDMRVASLKGHDLNDHFEAGNSTFNLMFVDSTLQGLRAVSVGQADAYIGNLAVTSHLIQEHNLGNLKVAAPVETHSEGGICFGVRSDWPELASLITKGLATITPQERSEIERKWLSVRFEHKTDWRDVAKLVAMVVGVGVMILMLVVLWNRRLSHEIDQRKVVESKLKEATDVARKASMAKGTFLANMSHEIRTPMNAILGFTQLLQRGTSLNPEQAEHLDIISRSGEHLLALINDILEVSKIEAGRTDIKLTTFDLHALLNDLDRMFRIRTTAKGVALSVEGISSVPQWVNADEGKIRQILINVIGNSIKFTEAGAITVRLSSDLNLSTGESDKPLVGAPVMLFCDIEDTGVGIADDELEKVFSKFEQTQSGVSAKSGTGLGLAISQQYVRLMGGAIKVRSQVGQGTVFSFELPVTVGDETLTASYNRARPVKCLTPGQPEYRILIADDRDTNRLLLQKMLTTVGFVINEAENGEEALALYHEWRPDLILMDMVMPVMDGFEAIKRIREEEGGGKRLPILAVTASVMEDEKQKVLAGGADDFVRKPFYEAELLELIRNHLNADYIYADDEIPGTGGDARVVLTPKDLDKLPKELLAQMHDAALGGYLERLHELIVQVAEYDADVAAGLTNLVDNFQYDSLNDLFNPGDTR